MSFNAWVSGNPVRSKPDPKEAWLKTPGLADAPSTPKEAVLKLQVTEAHREPAILEELQDKELELQVTEAHRELQDTETQYSREPEPFLEQEELRDTGRRAPGAALP